MTQQQVVEELGPAAPSFSDPLPEANKMSDEFIETCIKQHHDYARHIFTCTVTWFTFFVGVNYVTMGWFASSKAEGSTNALLMVMVLFVLQNLLAFIACFVIRSNFDQINRRILKSQAQLTGAKTTFEESADLIAETCMPLRFYSTCMILMAATIAILLIAWCLFPIFLRR